MTLSSRALAIVVATASWQSIACSEIVGIEDRSGRWCAVEGDSHDFCEDFDRPDAFSAWNLQSGGGATVTSSERSDPSAFLAANGVVIQRRFEASQDVAVELDLLLVPAPPDDKNPSTSDHAIALISRSGGSAGLFAGVGGALFFGWMSSLPGGVKIAAVGQWVRLGISIEGGEDAKQARLTVDGVVVHAVTRPGDPSKPDADNPEKGRIESDVILGSQPLAGATTQVRCEFDNVTVDLSGAPTGAPNGAPTP